MRITFNIPEFTRNERNSHCDVLHIAPVRVANLVLDDAIAAIASSRKSLATRTAAICDRFQGRRVRHEYVTMHITFLTRKSALIYRRGLRQRVASLTLDCNGVFAIRAYDVTFTSLLLIPCITIIWHCILKDRHVILFIQQLINTSLPSSHDPIQVP